MRTLICVLGVVCICASCKWQEAKEVIAVADSLDQTEHVIYDDTAALGGVIRRLDNPVGRLLMSNTLGKAYYYMGRNLDDYYGQIKQAAECYIMADRLQIDDPIYRGRVNSCMGYICAQNNKDSLALIFYERSNKAFKESANEWYYAQSLLNISRCYIDIQSFIKADSVLQHASSFQLDSAYLARYCEQKGRLLYILQQYDSALIYFNQGLDYWQWEEKRCFCYLKIMQIYCKRDNIVQAVKYAQYIIEQSKNPNYLVNAYYCLIQDAKKKNSALLLSKYSHARADAHKLLNISVKKSAEAIPLLENYLQNPHPLRWIRITIIGILLL